VILLGSRTEQSFWDLFENSAVVQEGAEGLAGVGGLLALAEALSCARHKSATSCGGCDGSLGRGLNLCTRGHNDETLKDSIY
jgi:hypothetical protein